MVIIGICGRKGSGKTTLATYLCENHKFIEYTFAEPLKDIARIFGFTHQQLYGTQEDKLSIHPYLNVSAREFLQKFGTEICKQQLSLLFPNMPKNIWLYLMKQKLDANQLGKRDNIVIHDVRFQDEAELIRSYGGVIVRVHRNHLGPDETDETNSHISETEQEKISCDYHIYNNQDRGKTFEQMDDTMKKMDLRVI